MLEGSLSPRTPLSQDAPDRAAYKHQSCRSQFWGLEIRGQGAGVARRGPSPRSDFLLCAHTAEGAGELSGGVSVIRTLIPVTKAPPTRPHQLPKAPPPNAITLGIRILTREFGPQTFGPRQRAYDRGTPCTPGVSDSQEPDREAKALGAEQSVCVEFLSREAGADRMRSF